MDRIETLREKAQTINGQFTGSLFRFPLDAEAKPNPRETALKQANLTGNATELEMEVDPALFQ